MFVQRMFAERTFLQKRLFQVRENWQLKLSYHTTLTWENKEKTLPRKKVAA